MVSTKDTRKVAIVVPAILDGGVPNVAEFLYRILAQSADYGPDLILIATSSIDSSSVRLLSPRSWFRGVTISRGEWKGYACTFVGAMLTEFEFQRYRSRPQLTELLNEYDLVQIVSGSPQWGLVAKDYRGPLALQVATLTAVERITALAEVRQPRRSWSKLMTRIGTSMERSALNRADAIFVENQWMYDSLKQQCGSQKVLFAPPGIDTEYFSPLRYREDSYILSVARFSDPRKNVRLLLEAYSRLRISLPDAPKLVLVGHSVPTQGDLAASSHLRENVEILEDVSREELRGLYRDASLFVLSSNEEGLGLVVLEAMACGLPVIATRCGGPETAIVPELTGLLTPVQDGVALAAAMQRLIDNRALRIKMGHEGRRVAEERFSFSAAGRPFLQKYDELIRGRPVLQSAVKDPRLSAFQQV